MPSVRLEKDALGSLNVPLHAYYGIHTTRALKNFSISGLKAHPRFIEAFVLIKKAAALTNQSLKLIPPKKGSAIVKACNDVLSGKYRDQFVVDVFQMGAGTSFHMNVNEVLANRAIEIVGGDKGDVSVVHPNDDVNFGQSTNDVFPTAIRVATRIYLEELIPVIEECATEFFKKGKQFDGFVKSARTHLQDAVPIRLGQEFQAYGVTIKKSLERIKKAAKSLEELGLGGSAAGTGLNTHPFYAKKAVAILRKETKLPFTVASDLREAMQSQRCLSEVSGSLRDLAQELIRISNDIRLLASGPSTGLGEIVVPAVQAGSSIMPGKVNPSMAEMLNMVCFQVIGNDHALSLAVQAGQLELNVMMPLMAFDLMFSIEILKNGVQAFSTRCVKGIRANKEKCRHYADVSSAIATVLNPLIGYSKVAEIVNEAVSDEKTIVQVLKEKNILSSAQLKKILDLKKLTEPGIHK